MSGDLNRPIAYRGPYAASNRERWVVATWDESKTKHTRTFDTQSNACRYIRKLAEGGAFPSLTNHNYQKWIEIFPPGTRVGSAKIETMPAGGKATLRCDCGIQFDLHPSVIALRRGPYCTPKCRLRCVMRNWNAAHQNAKTIGVEFELTRLDVLELRATGLCSYRHCGHSLPRRGSGLDRKDSRIGYTRNNCVACCTRCNTIKGGFLSGEDWQAVLDARHQRGILLYWPTRSRGRRPPMFETPRQPS